MQDPCVCLVTIHGIGFQEPPSDGVPGYADGLHGRLAAQLPDLSDDPRRRSWQTDPSVPVYVRSSYPEQSGTREQGLARLGRWIDKSSSTIEIGDAPLVSAGGSVAHVALVYAETEDIGPQPEATAEAVFKALAEHAHYGSILSTVHLLLADAATAVSSHWREPSASPTPSLKPRTDVVRPRHLSKIWHHKEDQSEPAGVLGTFRQIEDDVCAYVCRNDQREQIRSFVREALLRLAARDDVGAVVLNTHSNGTVIGFDALRDLPAGAARKVRTFITAGSPLRKYAGLFTWGYEVGSIRDVGAWHNYFDRHDPVADPLAHALGWRQGESGTGDAKFEPFVSRPPESAADSVYLIVDHEVDNVTNSQGGGLQAHNYWDNEKEFIPALAATLASVAPSRD